MKIGIIYYSQTGHIQSVVEKLEGELSEKGHTVVIDPIKVEHLLGDDRAVTANEKLLTIPNTNEYEGIIFAAPVQGFSLARIMPPYFNHVGSLENKKVAFFIGHQLPVFFGCNKAIRKMNQMIQTKGGKSCAHFDIRWTDEAKENVINDGIHKLSLIFE